MPKDGFSVVVFFSFFPRYCGIDSFTKVQPVWFVLPRSGSPRENKSHILTFAINIIAFLILVYYASFLLQVVACILPQTFPKDT